MAKSFTRKDKVNPGQVEHVTDLASQYVRQWTRVEAQKLTMQIPCILPTKSGFQVGKYSVKKNCDTWTIHNCFDELVETFTSKQSAVTYCILYQVNRFTLAQQLLGQDIKLNKLTQDQFNYVHRKTRAVAAHDTFTIDVIESRIAETHSLMLLARVDLEKTLNKAKYLKGIWE